MMCVCDVFARWYDLRIKIKLPTLISLQNLINYISELLGFVSILFYSID
jgi:hypothetical protein